MKRPLSGFWSVFILLAVIAVSCAPRPRFRADQMLRTDGMRIVNESGDEVPLYGVNLGNWLLVEPWMLKLDNKPGIKSGRDIFDKLEARFGEETARSLYRTYVDSFINEKDFRYIASLGMNFIRLPFWYAALFDPKYAGEEMSALDQAVAWAKKYNLYVLIDLHGAPGGQNTGVNILGEDVPNKLWSSPELQEKTVRIWQRIAQKYRDEKIVAGYDLLNEAWGAPLLPHSMKTLVAFYDRLYRAIREIDTNHMIFMEDALQGIHRMPHPSVMGWENVVYSFHYYPDVRDMKSYVSAYAEKLPNLRRAQMYFNVPFHVGEFSSIQLESGGVATMRRFFDVFTAYGWAWNFWSYKKIEDNPEYNWGLVGTVDVLFDIDLDQASAKDIRELFSEYDSKYLKKNLALEGAIRDFTQSLASKRDTRVREPLTYYPEDAYLSRGAGGNLRIEWGKTAPNFGWWGDNDSVTWTVNVPEDGIYQVRIDYAFGSRDARPVVGLWLNDAFTAEFPVLPTGSWDSYKTGAVAAVRLSGGRNRIRFLTKRTDQGVMNLRSLTLVPTNTNASVTETEGSRIRLSPLFVSRLEPADGDTRVEWQNSPGNIGHWRNGEKAVWVFVIPQAGAYRLSFDFSSPLDKSKTAVSMNQSQARTIQLPKTGEWHSYRRVEGGLFWLTKGTNTLMFQSVTADPGGAGNLGEIYLERTGD